MIADDTFEINPEATIGMLIIINENGIMATGWVFVGNHYYYMDQWGAMLTGWVYVDGHYYYMDQWGAMLTGWVYVILFTNTNIRVCIRVFCNIKYFFLGSKVDFFSHRIYN